ncbi:MAG: hypothetical protein A2V58_07740 [Candidatus Muproteobacteria bacterium RBG_19FT_COMBO_61_10]|uniref:Uncharacterized protein n=1 Tax=Candidatus Muproteobacteria bacterium RBG_19FT_COMBO_61_10 TaxID=1817761 RepID=A0A1F6UGF0_9PROT|nr:MAG: hypothetical protein A2V58_07740 [Candidatus Muproteobacteria bacterium RBG_19FT_COMBO_61_10]
MLGVGSVLLFRWGHGVIASGVPGMAAQQARTRKPGAFQGTVVFDGIEGVMGTRGIEAAMVAQQWADQIAVAADQ